MPDKLPLREQARQEFRKAFGEPQVLKVIGGEIDRWVLERPHRRDVYVTLDAPELPDTAHVMVSDPASAAVDPITSTSMRTIEEVRSHIQRIVHQWKNPPPLKAG